MRMGTVKLVHVFICVSKAVDACACMFILFLDQLLLTDLQFYYHFPKGDNDAVVCRLVNPK